MGLMIGFSRMLRVPKKVATPGRASRQPVGLTRFFENCFWQTSKHEERGNHEHHPNAHSIHTGSQQARSHHAVAGAERRKVRMAIHALTDLTI